MKRVSSKELLDSFRTVPTSVRGGVQPHVFAHRGASAFEKENTVEAFKRSWALGCHGNEFDVRLTKDKEMVIFHNPEFEDLITGKKHAISATLKKDLPSFIPTITEAIEASNGWINVEIKNDPRHVGFDPTDEIAVQVALYLKSLNEPHRFLLSCFRRETMLRFRKVAPEIRIALLSDPRPEFEDAEQRGALLQSLVSQGFSGLHPRQDALSRELVDECHQFGLQVNTWVLDDEEGVKRAIKLRVDGICCNDPHAVLGFLDTHWGVEQVPQCSG